MDKLQNTSNQLEQCLLEFDSQRELELTKIREAEESIARKHEALLQRKCRAVPSISPNDTLQLNVGGRVMSARRSTLTQWKGTRLESLFSGRWEDKLQRDGEGRIFLDVNPACFEAILQFLGELRFQPPQSPRDYPFVGEEEKGVLYAQMEVFGLSELVMPVLTTSEILMDMKTFSTLHDWLEEEQCDGFFHLLYRSSRDGLTNERFHEQCDGKGSTLTIIQTEEGLVFGGFANTAWAREGGWVSANKAFLFALHDRPIKMRLKDASSNSVYHTANCGANFGTTGCAALWTKNHQLRVQKCDGFTPTSASFTPDLAALFFPDDTTTYTIAQMEVFQVRSFDTPVDSVEHPTITAFSPEINEAMNAKWKSIRLAEHELARIEKTFEDEERFIETFAAGSPQDIVTLNVCGTTMATKRKTLDLKPAQFLQSKEPTTAENKPADNESAHEETKEETDSNSRKSSIDSDWETPVETDLSTWIQNNTNASTVRTIMDALESGADYAKIQAMLQAQMESSSPSTTWRVEHSPYCFSKLLDYLRLTSLHSNNLVDAPAMPVITASKQHLFDAMVNKYMNESLFQ